MKCKGISKNSRDFKLYLMTNILSKSIQGI